MNNFKVIKTAYKSIEFDEETKKLLERINNNDKMSTVEKEY